MKKTFFAISLLAISICAQAASYVPTGFFSGNELYDWLSNPAKKEAAYIYISGVADNEGEHYKLNESVYPRRKGRTLYGFICFPERGITLSQLGDIVKIYLEKNPENRHLGASTSVREALLKAYPCDSN